jgi:hypothetical protein
MANNHKATFQDTIHSFLKITARLATEMTKSEIHAIAKKKNE